MLAQLVLLAVVFVFSAEVWALGLVLALLAKRKKSEVVEVATVVVVVVVVVAVAAGASLESTTLPKAAPGTMRNDKLEPATASPPPDSHEPSALNAEPSMPHLSNSRKELSKV